MKVVNLSEAFTQFKYGVQQALGVAVGEGPRLLVKIQDRVNDHAAAFGRGAGYILHGTGAGAWRAVTSGVT
ncbi:hypothetical protein BFN67_20885 [Pseudaminobacter manganicus]|uniref:Uncharacterized protein n=1 Tax=Manganibacter manganicus TaxID=1873176 RepID=A0A1V8RNE1_9HYPH|nr:hypothetical protein BFN67_20885 [Pseudaminobacter manganicus]